MPLILRPSLRVVVLLCFTLAACQSQLTPATESVSTPTTPANAQPSATAQPRPAATALPPTQTPVPEPHWTSWAAGNFVRTVALHGDQLFAGGPGGVTVWNTADGSVVRRITTGDGLPSPAVNALWVDDDGTLWVATEGGLARLTSDRVILYTAADGLDSNNVTALARVRGTLVIGTAYSGRTGGGLLRLRESGWEPVGGFPSADPNQSPGRLSYNVSLIREDPLTASGLWVGTTNGLGYFDGEKWMRFSKTDGLPDNFVSALYFDKNNTLWVGTAAGAVRFDGKQFQSFRQLREMLGSWVVGITQDDAGRYWFSGASGIVSYDPSVADWQKFDSQNGNLPTYTMLVAARAADGALYFGSEGGGLVRYDGGFKTWTLPNIPVSMSFGRVLPAPDGSVLFVREYGVQVDRFDPATRTWSTPEGLPCDYCAPLAFDAQSRMWAASDRGLWIITGQESVHLTKDQGLPGNNVISVALAPDGSAWIGTDGGLAQWDGQTVKQVFNADNSGFSGSFIRKVLAASDGSVWVSTETNLSHLKADGTWEHFRPRAPFSFDVRVNDLAEAGDGAIWAATAGDGVYRFADEAWTRFRSDAPGVILPNGDVNSVTAAPDGSVWVSLAFNGVARFDGQEWSLFNVKEGLIHSNVLDIYVDNAGTAWFATSGGVTRWGP